MKGFLVAAYIEPSPAVLVLYHEASKKERNRETTAGGKALAAEEKKKKKRKKKKKLPEKDKGKKKKGPKKQQSSCRKDKGRQDGNYKLGVVPCEDGAVAQSIELQRHNSSRDEMMPDQSLIRLGILCFPFTSLHEVENDRRE